MTGVKDHRQRAALTKRQRTEAAVLAAAETLFREQGWARTSVEAIAREAGVGPASVYRRFRNKNVLAGLVFAPFVTDLIASATLPTGNGDYAQLMSVIADAIVIARTQRPLTVAMLEAVNDSTARGRPVDEADPRYYVPLPFAFAQIIARGQKSGSFYVYPSAAEAGAVLSNNLLLRVFTRPNETAAETIKLVETLAERFIVKRSL